MRIHADMKPVCVGIKRTSSALSILFTWTVTKGLLRRRNFPERKTTVFRDKLSTAKAVLKQWIESRKGKDGRGAALTPGERASERILTPLHEPDSALPRAALQRAFCHKLEAFESRK